MKSSIRLNKNGTIRMTGKFANDFFKAACEWANDKQNYCHTCKSPLPPTTTTCDKCLATDAEG